MSTYVSTDSPMVRSIIWPGIMSPYFISFLSISLSLSLSLPLTFTNGIQCLLPSFFFSYMSINLSLVLSTYPSFCQSVNWYFPAADPGTKNGPILWLVEFFVCLIYHCAYPLCVPTSISTISLFMPSYLLHFTLQCLPTYIHLPTYLSPT